MDDRDFRLNFRQALTSAHRNVSSDYPLMHIRSKGNDRLELEFRKESRSDGIRLVLTFETFKDSE